MKLHEFKHSRIFREEHLFWIRNCIVVEWRYDHVGLPIGILKRNCIKKNEDVGQIKLNCIYSVKLNERYEQAKVVYCGGYIECTKYLTFWFKKNVKEVVTPCKRKRSEVDDDIDLNIEQTIYVD